MKTTPPISRADLIHWLDYSAETGDFRWKARPRNATAVVIGAVAGWINAHGYRVIKLGGRCYLAHRLAWFYVHGTWPADDTDHINRIRSDNRLANLRPATRSQNSANTGARAKNAAGIKGVHYRADMRKWHARIYCKGRNHPLGWFSTKEEAGAAYARAAAELFGEFGSGK